jgi:hypothetical protein
MVSSILHLLFKLFVHVNFMIDVLTLQKRPVASNLDALSHPHALSLFSLHVLNVVDLSYELIPHANLFSAPIKTLA